MQPFIHLPIIKFPNKTNIPNSSILRPLPWQRSFYRGLLVNRNTIQPRESHLEKLIPIPPILPKSHSIPQPNNKLRIFAKILLAHSSPNFEATTLLHSRFSSFTNRYNHFPNNALLKVVSFLIPKPPLAMMGAQTLSHPTKWVLLSLHRKALCNFSILWAT